jgi:Domain of unknown function (DUF4249)
MKAKYWFLLLVFTFSCKEKYMPEIHVPSTGFLVVEGFINVGTGSTNISLTRASSLDSMEVIPQTGAQVEVQSENGSVYPLFENGPGKYTIDQIPAEPSQQYRLDIRMSNGKEYISDYSSYKSTPEIDSVNWKSSPDNIYIYVNTHDDKNQTLYYQWQFDETWEYHSAFLSIIKYQDHEIQYRANDEFIYTCWQSDVSTNIIIGSSAKLQSDVISEQLLTTIPFRTNNKFGIRYSILARQYALSRDWYEWKQKVQKNTEQLGTIFDAQPSETGGNFHCVTDPTETIVGFVGCTTETEKRIFIDAGEIPFARLPTGYESCTIDTIPYTPQDLERVLSGPNPIPINEISVMGIVTGVAVSIADCVDCRAKGGVNVKPDFWQ